MKKLVIALLVIAAVAGCSAEREQAQVETKEAAQAPSEGKTIEISWQRYVDDGGATCDRCSGTGAEIERARRILWESFAPEDIDVVMKQKALSADAVAADMSQSNRIWIAGRALEDWLGAEVGMSACGGCCGELACAGGKADKSGMASCRTLIHEGNTYEAIPADLIVKAGFMAASEMLGREVTLCCKGVGICTCGGDESACEGHSASGCDGCPNAAACQGHSGSRANPGCTGVAPCQAHQGKCDPSECGSAQTTKTGQKTCPRSKQCAGGVCPAGG
jgi:hypothetical protein